MFQHMISVPERFPYSVMEGAKSALALSLSVLSVYFIYVHVYCSHRLLSTNVLSGDKLPSFVYLYVKYLTRVLTRRAGHLNGVPATRPLVYTVLNCRLESSYLRKFCSAAGYGWDYPDTEYRDIPLCFPEFLCCRLLVLLLTDGNFRLNPAGLVRVRQSLKTFQPIDELKKGPFMLQAKILRYQQMDAGVEVDICLTATCRSGSPVWKNIMTLLSKNRLHKSSRCLPRDEDKSHLDEPVPENMKQVELSIPRTTGLHGAWSFSDYSPHRLLSLPASFFGFTSQTAPSLWMLSVCMAEIEKHRGVEVIRAPINVTAQFKEPLLVPGKVGIRFWEQPGNVGQSSATDLRFSMEQQGHCMSHVVGLISRSQFK